MSFIAMAAGATFATAATITGTAIAAGGLIAGVVNSNNVANQNAQAMDAQNTLNQNALNAQNQQIATNADNQVRDEEEQKQGAIAGQNAGRAGTILTSPLGTDTGANVSGGTKTVLGA